jgi:hypothetical protein
VGPEAVTIRSSAAEVSDIDQTTATVGTKEQLRSVKVKMSSRSLRSKASTLAAEEESETGRDSPPKQPSQLSDQTTISDEINGQVGQDKITGEQEQTIEREKFRLSENDVDESEVCREKGLSGNDDNLLKLMWKAIQEIKGEQKRDRIEQEKDRKEQEKDRIEQERFRREFVEKHEKSRIEQERFRHEFEEKQERNRREDRERLEQIIGQFKKNVETCEEKVSKLAVDFSDLENKTEHSIAEVKGKIKNIEQTQSQQIPEARGSDAAVETKLAEHKKGVEDSLATFREELDKYKEDMMIVCINEIGVKLDAVSRDSSTGLAEIAERLHGLEERTEAATRIGVLGSRDSQIVDIGGRRQTEISPTDVGTEGFRHSAGSGENQENGERRGVVRPQSDTCNNNSDDEIVRIAGGGTPQLIHDLAKDIGLPKFTDPSKQYIVHFLNDLESYFQLRGIPDSLKLVIAKSAVVDNYTSQWINTVYRDLQNYHQFREAITEFLWGPQAQSKWRCALYQGKYDADKDGSMTAHFLRYSAVASNLTPKITEAEMVDMISGHYPAYVQRTLLSARVKTIRDVLNLLNRLESIETYGEEDSNPGASARNRADSRNHFPRHRITPGFQNVRNMRYQGTRDNHAHRQRNDHRQERGGKSDERGVQEVQCRMASHSDESHRTLNATAKSYVPSSAVGESSLNAAKLDQGN